MELIQTITDYFKNKRQVQAVYLFGSYASGKPGPTSDIDLGLFLNNQDQSSAFQQRERYQIELSRALRKDLHIAILNFAGELLLKQVFSKGRCLLINDQNALSVHKMTAYAKIADFGYYRPIFSRAFAQKIMQG